VGPSRDYVETDDARILAAAETPRTLPELMALFEVSNRTKFRRKYIQPLLQSGRLRMTVPERPRSRLQKYVAVTAPRPDEQG
jgi:ATP-dependent DNA helicase RecG